ncbi:MAG: hypothetical protein OEU26_22505 [Candidatus Tectomicrobia bacterium]|nr:hypothetical protein [Candidatus Tectomicrobia bacterium]
MRQEGIQEPMALLKLKRRAQGAIPAAWRKLFTLEEGGYLYGL